MACSRDCVIVTLSVGISIISWAVLFVNNVTGEAVITGGYFTYSKRCGTGADVGCIMALIIYPLLIGFNGLIVSMLLSPFIGLFIWSGWVYLKRIWSLASITSAGLIYLVLAGVFGLPLLGAVAYDIGGGDIGCNFASYARVMTNRCWLEGVFISIITSFGYLIASTPILLRLKSGWCVRE